MSTPHPEDHGEHDHAGNPADSARGGGHGHAHGLDEIRHERPLWWALVLTACFLVAEVVGAWITDSLALLSDAAHMVTDVAALGIALAAIRIGRRPADDRRTYGYRRLEVLAASVNALVLLGVAIYILLEAIERFKRPPDVQTTGMLVIGVLGMVVNLIAMKLLAAGSGASINVRGAYLEVWSDMLGSVGVIVAALIIRFTGWQPIDPIIAVGIALWVVPRSWSLLREAGNVLLEGVPAGVDIAAIRKSLEDIPGVGDVHDLHVWSLSSGRHALTAHLVLDVTDARPDDVIATGRRLLDRQFAIGHSTLQVESRECAVRHEACDVPATVGDSGGQAGDHDHPPDAAADKPQ